MPKIPSPQAPDTTANLTSHQSKICSLNLILVLNPKVIEKFENETAKTFDLSKSGAQQDHNFRI